MVKRCGNNNTFQVPASKFQIIINRKLFGLKATSMNQNFQKESSSSVKINMFLEQI